VQSNVAVLLGPDLLPELSNAFITISVGPTARQEKRAEPTPITVPPDTPLRKTS
jgi:hypothetical protein